jgi:hypothetical protein
MRPLASLYFVNAGDLPAVAAAGQAGVLDALRAHGRECEEEYFWSGDRLLLVVQYLWRVKGISLFSVVHDRLERKLNTDEGSAVLILGPEHRAVLPKLDMSKQDIAVLADGLAAWGVPRAEARVAAADAVELLSEQITRLDDETVLIVHVG